MGAIELEELQTAVELWNKKNFPNGTADDVLIGATEELGELAHAHLKAKQGIRGSDQKHFNDACDAVGDIIIYLMAYCAKKGISLQQCILQAWDEVSQRDWTKNKENGT